MKTNYPLVNSYKFERPKSSLPRAVFLVIAAAALYLWGSGSIGDFFSVISYPYLRLSGNIDRGLREALISRRQLLADWNKLKQENVSLRNEIKELEHLRVENETLRGLRQANPPANYQLAKILVRPDQLPYDELIIDLGREKYPQLSPGQLVLADKDTILGQIEVVYDHSAKVKLYSESGVSLPVAVGEAAYPSVALGQGAGNFSLSLPRGLAIKVGDMVRTTIVGDYLLGYVALIDKDPNDPFQKITFRSPYNFTSLNWIFISEADD